MLDWWQKSVIYQIYPKSFKDSNGDGIGDLKGIEQQVDYFTETGIEVIWLSPIFKSPMVDGGYDISDYKQIDPIFGTMADFDSLLATLKSRNIKLLLDFVPCHTSDQSDWFQKSVKKIAPYTDYYVWRDPKEWRDNGATPVPPNNWISVFEGSAWEYNAERKQFYLHQFAVKQPHLNYRCPAVVREMKNVLRFWLDKGVDGFRTDAVNYMFVSETFADEPQIKDEKINGIPAYTSLEHIHTTHLPETFNMLAEFRQLLDSYKEKDGHTRLFVTEVWAEAPTVVKYYGNKTRPIAHFSFNFNLTFLKLSSNAHDFVNAITSWIKNLLPDQSPNWVLGNHDVFRITSKFNKPLIDGLNMILLLLPGVAVSYNGDELGMENTHVPWELTQDPQALNVGPTLYESRTRDPARTPFQWSSAPYAGFTNGRKGTWLPVNSDYKEVNFEKQKHDDRSHWKVYRDLLKLRKNAAFLEGNFAAYVIEDDMFAFTRNLNLERNVVIVNLSKSEKHVDLKSKILDLPSKLEVVVSSLSSEYIPGSEKSGTVETNKFHMNPYSALVLRGFCNK